MSEPKPPNSRFYLPGSFQTGTPEIVNRSHFLAWLNSDEPNKLLTERYGSDTDSNIALAKEVFANRSAMIAAENVGQTHPVARDIVNPLAGADLTSAFLFGVDKAVMCDVAPLFYEPSDKAGTIDIYDFIHNVFKTGDVLSLLYGMSMGFDNVQDYAEGFTGSEVQPVDVGTYPPGYLGLIRLKIILGAEDIQVHKSDADGWIIKFNVKEEVNGEMVKREKQINYFDNTYFAETTIKAGDRSDTSEPFLTYLSQHPPSQVLLKGSHDFCFSESARRFWEIVGSSVPVFSDDLKSSIGQASRALPKEFNPTFNIDLYSVAAKLSGKAFVTAAYFGYGSSIQRYLSAQFVKFFETKPRASSEDKSQLKG